MKKFISLFSGLIYEVYEEEIPNLDDGQVPLDSLPKASCKHCYGRGYDSHDTLKGVYNLCRCMKKHIAKGYKPRQVRILPVIR